MNLPWLVELLVKILVHFVREYGTIKRNVWAQVNVGKNHLILMFFYAHEYGIGKRIVMFSFCS